MDSRQLASITKNFFLVTVIWFELILGDAVYKAEFSEDVKPCADFNNEMVNADSLSLGGEDGGLGLSGVLVINNAIKDNLEISLQISKLTEVGSEAVLGVQGNICDSVGDQNTPWFPLLDALNITECPIAVNDYTLDGMTLSLDFAQDALTHDYCGEYVIELTMAEKGSLDSVVCYVLGVAIFEESE